MSARGGGDARSEPGFARGRIQPATRVDELVYHEPSGRAIDTRQRRAVDTSRVSVPRRVRGSAAQVVSFVRISRRFRDHDVGGSNPGWILAPPPHRR